MNTFEQAATLLTEAERQIGIGAVEGRTARVRERAVVAAISDLGRKEGNAARNLMTANGRSIPEYWMWAEDPPGWEDWCAASVSHWIRRGLGLPDWPATGYAPTLPGHPFERWFVGVGQIFDWGEASGAFLRRPVAGCIFLDGKRHTGLVAYVEGDSVVTVEGNWSNQVSTVRRSTATLSHFVRWWAV